MQSRAAGEFPFCREMREKIPADSTGSTGCPRRGLPMPTAPRPVQVHQGARTPRAAPACQNPLVKALSLGFVLLPTLQAASKASPWQRLLNLAPLPCCLTMGKKEELTSESLPFVPTYFKDFFSLPRVQQSRGKLLIVSFSKAIPREAPQRSSKRQEPPALSSDRVSSLE